EGGKSETRRAQGAERCLPHCRSGDLRVGGEEGEGLAPQLVAQRRSERAGKEQGTRLVAQSDQLRRRNPRGEIAAYPFVPHEALQLEHGHHPQPAVEVQERALEVAGILAEAAQDGGVSLGGVVRRAQLPLAPVIAPERLHLGVVALVELAGGGDERLQRALEVAAQEVARDDALAVPQ